MRRKNPHAQQARELKKNRNAKRRAADVQRRGRADRRHGGRQSVVSAPSLPLLVQLVRWMQGDERIGAAAAQVAVLVLVIALL